MSKAKTNFRRPIVAILAVAGCSAAVLPLFAADGTTSSASTAVSEVRTESAQVALIRRLAERGAITAEDAAELVKLAEADAADARVQAALMALATAKADAARARAEAAAIQVHGRKNVVTNDLVETPSVNSVGKSHADAPAVVEKNETQKTTKTAQEAPVAAETVTFAPVTAAKSAESVRSEDDDTVRVTYVPEAVKAQLREEIKNDVIAQAKQERWATPRSVPDWVSRFTIYGDFRMRFEGIYNSEQNLADGYFPNFNAINTGSPYDSLGTVQSPQYNVDQDRSRLRIRARVGMAVDLGEGFTANLRFATGENNSPVSQNQTLGSAGSGQGGNFSKYAVWLDRACLKYQSDADLTRALTLTFGRFENPFLSTSVIWADDLGFDGAVLTIPVQIHFDGLIVDSIKPYFVVGAFPVFNTDLNYSSNRNDKFKSNDKWLEAGQFGLDLNFRRDLHVKLGAAYYYFTKTAGKLSSQYIPSVASDAGDTDARRPSFAQKGNTYMALRDILLTYDTAGKLTNSNWQYYGLATPFRNIAFDVRMDYNHFEPFQVSFVGEYVKNVGLDKTKYSDRIYDISSGAWFNAITVNNSDALGHYEGGDAAWMAGLRIGSALLQKRWDWAFNINYRQVESDAVIDGFCDSDFGGGGTNVKGLTLAGSVALSKRVVFGAKWMSSNQVSGPDFKNDILQIDLNAKF